jgi:uncharacterized protein (DUF58 family)
MLVEHQTPLNNPFPGLKDSSFLRRQIIRLKTPLTIRTINLTRAVATIEIRCLRIPTLFLISLILYLLTLSEVAALILGVFAAIHLLAYLWVLNAAHNTYARRRLLSVAVQVGDEIEEQIELENRSPLPLIWAEFVDRSTLPGYSTSIVAALSAHSYRSWVNRTICTLRGVYRMGPWELLTSDPLGIFLVRQSHQADCDLIVYPPLAEVPAHLLPQASAQGDAHFLRTNLRADSTKAITTRPIHPGDPMRHIHWPTTARREGIFVKGFEPEARSIIWMLLDLEAGSQRGQGDDSTLEKSIILVASLAEWLLRQRLSVGLFAQSISPTVVQPNSGLPHLWKILKGLSPLQTNPEQGLAQAIERVVQVVKPGHLVICITPSFNTGWIDIWKSNHTAARVGLYVLLLSDGSIGPIESHETYKQIHRRDVHAQIVDSRQIHPFEASYGPLQRWEFKTLPMGKTVAVKKPRSASAAFGQGEL